MSPAPAAARPRRGAAWALFALAGGAVWGLAFGREPWVVASWLALAPLFPLLGAPGGRRWTFVLGFLHGLAAWIVAIPWIVPTLRSYGELPVWLAWISLFILAGYLALYHGAFAVLGRPLWRWAVGEVAIVVARSGPGGAPSGERRHSRDGRGAVPPRRERARTGAGLRRLLHVARSRRPRTAPPPALRAAVALVGLPSLWGFLEWIRTWLFGGFPWNPAGHAWLEVPGALPTAAYIGVYGVGAMLVLANAGVALAVVRRRWVWGAAAVLSVLAVLGAGVRWGDGGAADPHRSAFGTAGEPVRMLQPNIPNAVRPDWETIEANYRHVLELSEAACEPGALLVWPESAAWPYTFADDPGFRRDVLGLAARGGCTVLFNSIQPAGERYYNSAYVVRPDGASARYDKRHLVPFGEYVPLAGVFAWLDKLARNAGDFLAAEDVALLPWRDERLGMSICYEIVFPAEVAEAVRAGATILVTITNDAWYGDTAAPWQHYAAARFRAAESRRPLLRAAITGVSALVAPDGAELARLDPFVEGLIRGRVEGERQLSPYTRRPWVVPVVAALLAAAALGVCALSLRS